MEKEKETQNRDTRGKKDRYSYDKNRGRGGVQHRKDNNYNKYIYNKPYWQKKKKMEECVRGLLSARKHLKF